MSTITSMASLVASDRSVPEDEVLVVRIGDDAVFAVADGAGGLGGGRWAAGIVIEAVQERLYHLASIGPDAVGWCRFLVEVDQRVLHDRGAGETTAVVGMIREGRVVGASVGDSEAWVIGEYEHVELTVDQFKKPRLGTGTARPVGFERSIAGCSILVATDGLFGSARIDAIAPAVRRASPQEAVHELVAAARSRSGKLYDDVGLVVIAVGS